MRRFCWVLSGVFALWVGGLALADSGAAAKVDKKAEKKADKKSESGKPTIPVITIPGSLGETPGEELSLFSGGPTVSLKEFVAKLHKAADDPNVKAIAILAGGSVGPAQTEELRQAFAKLRAAGKDIYVHGDSLSTREYVLLSGASRISLVPTGDFWLTGTFGETPYLRGLLDKLGVKPDFLHCGAYKSASEMFMREGPSKEAEEMQNWLLDSAFDTFIHEIAQGRKVSPDKVRAWIDNGPYTAEKAKEAGLIDAVEHRQDFQAMLKEKYGKDVVFNKKYGGKKEADLDFGNPFAIFKILGDLQAEGQKKKTGKAAVGIVYVDGAITLGGGSESMLEGASAGSTKVRKALDQVAADDAIKAVVLRIDSPGGSAVASEIILDATRRVKAKKPFVVSMGDVAGSGGYYVACAADTIFADKATITGSIGVVSGKLVTNPMWARFGVTFKTYKRGKNAGLLTSAETFSPEEREKMQTWMDDIYGVFKQHVVDARGSKLKKPIDELAGGRVYTGRQALDLGLVDKIGTLQDAIEFAAAQAKVKDYDVRVVPEPKNFLEVLLEKSDGGKDDSKNLSVLARPWFHRESVSLVKLALPYLQGLDPQRVARVKAALEQLQLLQQEGVVMMVPEVFIPR